MGSCVSSHKNSESTTKTKWWVSSKTSNNVLIHTPIKQEGSEENVIAFQDSNAVSKDDMFFDTGAWLESDNEEFCSVNGDFTPSRGNTPIHHMSGFVEVQTNASLHADKTPDMSKPSPNAQKKLAEFLHESFTENNSFNVDGNLQVTEADQIAPTGVLKPEPETVSQSISCCIPNLPRSLRFSHRKKLLG